MDNKIIVFKNKELELEVNMKEDTVWLTQAQMSELFNVDRTTITRHINNIYKINELDKKSTCANNAHMGNNLQNYNRNIYNLDVIISVGYRVNAKRGVIFRQWATKILKDYMLKGYAVNNKRLEFLEKKVQLIDIATRANEHISNNEIKDILNVINNYTKALDLLDDYDHQTVKKINGTNSDEQITYEQCINIIDELRFNKESNLFALERNKGLSSIINNIYLTYNKQDVYPSIEEKAANFLYLIVKDHTFIDGNKRIAATLFIYFLQFYNILYKNDKQIIDNNTLTSLTILIAESKPIEKNILIDLIMNFIINE